MPALTLLQHYTGNFSYVPLTNETYWYVPDVPAFSVFSTHAGSSPLRTLKSTARPRATARCDCIVAGDTECATMCRADAVRSPTPALRSSLVSARFAFFGHLFAGPADVVKEINKKIGATGVLSAQCQAMVDQYGDQIIDGCFVTFYFMITIPRRSCQEDGPHCGVPGHQDVLHCRR